MKKILLIFSFISVAFSQYIVGRNMFINIDLGFSNPTFFEKVKNPSDNFVEKSHRGKTNYYGVEIVHRFNFRHAVIFGFRKKTLTVKHSSTLLAGVYDTEKKNITASGFSQQFDYQELSVFYKRKFYPRKFFAVFGLTFYQPIEGKEIIELNETISYDKIGEISRMFSFKFGLGSDFTSGSFILSPYATYSLPVDYAIQKDDNHINLSELEFGLKLGLKIL
jgi:hypothetical protein